MQCEFCKKTFVRESSYAIHICEKKRRWLDKDNKEVKVAFYLFNQWHKMAMGSRKDKTFNEFMNGKFYTVFVTLALKLLDVPRFDKLGYIKWLVDHKVNFRDWPKNSQILKFTEHKVKSESPDVALERAVSHMNEWATEHNCQWIDYLTKAEQNQIFFDIQRGIISPWVVLGSQKFKDTLGQWPPEILEQLFRNIDIDYWTTKLSRCKSDVRFINECLV